MNKKVNGNANILNEDQERMRAEVVDLELKARYWKAQHDIRFYTLAAEKIQPEYDAYLEEQKKKREEMEKAFLEQLQKIQAEKEAGIATPDEVSTELPTIEEDFTKRD